MSSENNGVNISSMEEKKDNSSTDEPSVVVKKEMTPRLPSFKPPRDLSLGGTGRSTLTNFSLQNLMNPLGKTNKKFYAPNINVVRKKNVGSSEESSKSKDVKSNKPIPSNRRNANKQKPNVVQTQGVFSEGLAPGKVHGHSNSPSYGSSTTTQHVDKPKLNLNTKVCNNVEDTKMKDLLNDNFIDDPRNIPDLNLLPHTLPRVYNTQNEPVEEMDVDTTFESFQSKNEITKPGVDNANEKDEILKLFEESTEPKLLLFEFPSVVNVNESEEKLNKATKNKTNIGTVEQNDDKTTEGTFSSLNEGLWGTLNVHADGTSYIQVGDRKIPMTLIRHRPREEVMSVDIDRPNFTGEIIHIGPVQSSFACSSDENDILNL